MPRHNLASSSPSVAPVRVRYLAAQKRRSSTVSMLNVGPSLFGLGPSEAVVIGLAAYFLLGPKELFKLAKQAGNFLGEWRSLGLDAQRQFQEAMDAEDIRNPINDIREIANEFQAASFQSQFRPPTASSSSVAEPKRYDSIRNEVKQATEESILEDEESEVDEPAASTDSVNVKIRRKENDYETPKVLGAEEARLEVEIEQAENALETLRAEANILQLKRKQVEAAAAAARREADLQDLESPDANVEVKLNNPEAENLDVQVKIKTPEDSQAADTTESKDAEEKEPTKIG